MTYEKNSISTCIFKKTVYRRVTLRRRARARSFTSEAKIELRSTNASTTQDDKLLKFECKWIFSAMTEEFRNEIDLSVSEGMISEAKKAIAWREEFGRGATQVGMTRARQIIRDKKLSRDTWKRAYSFFSRHEVDKKAEGFRPGEEGYPSNGRIAWAAWGGDPGFARAKKIVGQIDREAKAQATPVATLPPAFEGRLRHRG